MAAVPKVKLNNGMEMPCFGLGTYTSQPGDLVSIVKAAIDCGYRHFDCALVYGNEKYLGQAIRDKISEGIIKREDVFVVSKLWNTFHRPDLVLKGCRKTLSNLGLDYVDLYLIHWPTAFKAVDESDVDKDTDEKLFILDRKDFFPMNDRKEIVFSEDDDYIDTWKAMEQCVDLGLAKSIGVSNFNSVQLHRLLNSARIKPVTNQVEVHPYLNQKRLIEFCMDRNIWVTAYGPLGLQIPDGASGRPKLVSNPVIIKLAEEIGRTPAQVILRYLVQLKTIPIPKTSKLERLKENISIFDFELTDKQMSIMDSLNCNGRICIIPGMEKHKNNPFAVEF